MKRAEILFICIGIVPAVVGCGTGMDTATGDWPAFNHDSRRSGVTGGHLEPPLHEQWTFHAPHKPAPAWPEPALRDIWNRNPRLNPRVTDDRAFHTIAVGRSVFFASSADDKVYALDAETGEISWTFFTGGPVRYAPAWTGGRLIVGSDDGVVYCLDAADGSLAWTHGPPDGTRMLPGNGRMISVRPVRTGIVVEDGIAYVASGLFPTEGVTLSALDAASGAVRWSTGPDDISPQGYLLASPKRLYVPTGRTAPVAFDRATGRLEGAFPTPHGDGGTFALVDGGNLVSGPGKELVSYDAASRERDQLLTFAGTRMIVDGGRYFLLSDGTLICYDRERLRASRREQADAAGTIRALSDSLAALEKKDTGRSRQSGPAAAIRERISSLERRIGELRGAEHSWKTPTKPLYSMILAGEILFCGGAGFVAAFDAESGKKVWESPVTGTAYGIAAANGRLFASTDAGTIHCFAEKKPARVKTVRGGKRTPPSVDGRNTGMTLKAARTIVETSGIDRGWCLVTGCGDGRLVYELARRTNLHIVGIDSDPKNVRAARILLDGAGLYGERASVHLVEGGGLPFADMVFNLVVSGGISATGMAAIHPGELYRVTRPGGGTILVGSPDPKASRLTRPDLASWVKTSRPGEWTISTGGGLWASCVRPPLPGAGEWTHQYAGPGNTSSSGDTVVRPPMRIQWFGRPGPRHINDRHHRPMAPLSKNGRVFVIGDNYLIAADAYNGAILWERAVPGIRRIGVIRDSGHAVVTDDLLYVAAGEKCLGLDVATGYTAVEFPVPQLPGIDSRHWGYLASDGDLLFGSGVKPSAPRTELSRDQIVEGTYFDNRPVVSGDCLFCLDRSSGEPLWTRRGGMVPDSAIAIDGASVYFIESDSPAAMSDDDGRVLLTDAFAKGHARIVKLDRRTGETSWSRPFDPPFTHVVYLMVKETRLVAVGSYNRAGELRYGLFCFDTASGRPLWENDYAYGSTLNGDHGEQDQHPVIIGDTIFSRPCAFSLATGEKLPFTLVRGGHGCGTISGSARYLFGRGGNPRMYDIDGDGGSSIALSTVNRPGCFVNMIPAGGLVLLPESSSGCSCAYPVQASVAYAPVSAGSAR